MIATDDPRHGTTAGFHAGCRDICCRRALARYAKRRRLEALRGGLAVPALGAQRRIQALMRLGWTSNDIAAHAGWAHRNHVLRILNGQKGKPTTWLERSTDATVRRVYEELCMTVPDRTGYRARTIKHAERNGFAPPLAWDDIDHDEKPYMGTDRESRPRDDIDEVVVLRLLDGEQVPCTTAEKDEAMRRWRAAGGSEAEMCRRQGWKSARYGREVAA